MRKSDSEPIVRRLCHDWLEEQPIAERDDPRYWLFESWLLERQPGVLDFHSTMGSREDAERWFDDELGQNWRR
jgi:hypothetical protein